MSSDSFTKEETVQGIKGSIPLLLRYLREVPLLRVLIIPNFALALLTSVAAQAFIWFSGKLAECEGRKLCPVEIPVLELNIDLNLSVLFFLMIFLLFIRIFEWTMFEAGSQLAALPLFKRMTHALGGVRTTFFDQYPSGKIINRVVRDFDQLKFLAPMRLGDATIALVELLTTAFIIGLVSPLAAVIVIPAFAAFLFIQSNVAPMLQKTMVLRSIRFGEVLHRETDVIEGARSFVLYNQTQPLLKRFQSSVLGFMQMHFLRGQIEAWGRFWCDTAVAIYGFIALIAVAVGLQSGAISAVLGALVVTAIFRLGAVFGWLTWSLGFLFETAGHARRVFEYVDLVPEEKEEGVTTVQDSRVLQYSALILDQYSMSYRETSPLILKELSLRIEPGTKVGIVGRTGAGKTSLIQALYRMVYVRGGDIRIGERSLYSLPAKSAREYFSVVPQDPYLFAGTVRTNLDRYKTQTDDVLLAVLKTVNLDLTLDYAILEGGANLSLGQRQLLCLARVIISKALFVIMDEPTSGVDTITDSIIHTVLRNELKDRTVITIAHRLETLTKVDRVIELKDGRVARDGAPGEIIPLLTREDLGE